MTTEQFDKLIEAGLLDKIELIDGRIMQAGHELVLAPEQERLARRLGVRVRSCVDAVLEDPQARAELTARLGS
jgi:hypothetical protein